MDGGIPAEPELHDGHEPVDAVGKILIAANNMRAFLNISMPKYGGNPFSPEQIRNLIADSGICHGLRELTVSHLSAMPLYDRDVLIAEGTPPRKGKDGTLVYHVRLSKDATPTERPDGSVDFKNLGIIENVEKEQLLCLKVPPEPGTDGMDILGNTLPALPGKEVPLPVGKNTYIAEDQLELRALINGQCDFVDRRLNVMETFTVEGDVSTATGNISFVGNVVVYGNVLAGFAVQAGGNIQVQGCVEGASMTAGGNVTIMNGFHGMNKGEIVAGGSVRCKYIQSGRVRAGSLVETQLILSSDVRSGDAIRLISKRSTIMGGSVTAKNLVECQKIGGQNNPVLTIVEVGSDPFLLTRSQELKQETEGLKKSIADLDRLLLLFSQLKDQNRLTPDKHAMMLKSANTRRTSAETLVGLLQEAEDVRLKLATEGYGTIVAHTAIYAGTRILIGPERSDINTPTGSIMVSRGEEGLFMQPPAAQKKK